MIGCDWERERGMALVTVVGLLAVLCVILSATAIVVRGQVSEESHQREDVQAYYIADAGVVRAIKELRAATAESRQPDVSGLNNVAYGNGRLMSVDLSGPVNGMYTIVSTGKCPDPETCPGRPNSFFSVRTITVTVKAGGAVTPGGGSEPGSEEYFTKGIWTNSLTIDNAADIMSNVYCTGDVRVDNATRFGKDGSPINIYANGDATFGNGCKLRGNIFSRNDIDLSNGDSVSDTLQSLGDVTLGNGNKITGAVLAKGNITINNGSNFNLLQADGFVRLHNSVTVNNTIKAIGNVELGNANRVKGDVWTMGNLIMRNSNEISGAAYVHGDYRPGNGGKVVGGVHDLESMDPLALDIPVVSQVPLPSLNYYKAEAEKVLGHYYDSSKKLDLSNFNENGIYFINGDLTFRSLGSFEGQTTIACAGNMFFSNGQDLTLSEGASLLLISGGRISFANANRIEAFLWAKERVSLANADSVKGCIISPTIDMDNSSQVIQVEPPQEDFRVVSWQ